MRLARAWIRKAQRLLPTAEGGTVLAYHLVGAGTSSPVDLPLETFRGHLETVLRSGGAADPAALSELPSNIGNGSRGRVLLTFDDAFENFYQTVYPLLREVGAKVLLFVPVGFVAGTSGSPLAGAERLPPMTWSQLREVVRSGAVAVGSHSLTHPDLRRLDARSLREELVGSRDRLQEELGVAVPTFCYPRALWSPRVEAVVAEVYSYAFAAGGRQVPAGRRFRPCRIPRVPIRRDMSSIEALLRGRVWLEEWLADKVRRRVR